MVLQWYRFRWQIELVFKRFKQIAQLGHFPKHDPQSAKAWLYGKLFVALLTEKVIEQARALSPWGYELLEMLKRRSQWSEFTFAFRQVTQAIQPRLSLRKTIEGHWDRIATGLRESPRSRKGQEEQYHETS